MKSVKEHSFSHRELARWQNYFIRNERDDLAKRINPLVGTEAGTNSEGQISNLTHLIQSSAANSYSKIQDQQKKEVFFDYELFQTNFHSS